MHLRWERGERAAAHATPQMDGCHLTATRHMSLPVKCIKVAAHLLRTPYQDHRVPCDPKAISTSTALQRTSCRTYCHPVSEPKAKRGAMLSAPTQAKCAHSGGLKPIGDITKNTHPQTQLRSLAQWPQVVEGAPTHAMTTILVTPRG